MVQKITATPSRRTERRERRLGRGGVSVRTPVKALLPALAQRVPISSGDHESPTLVGVITMEQVLPHGCRFPPHHTGAKRACSLKKDASIPAMLLPTCPQVRGNAPCRRKLEAREDTLSLP